MFSESDAGLYVLAFNGERFYVGESAGLWDRLRTHAVGKHKATSDAIYEHGWPSVSTAVFNGSDEDRLKLEADLIHQFSVWQPGCLVNVRDMAHNLRDEMSADVLVWDADVWLPLPGHRQLDETANCMRGECNVGEVDRDRYWQPEHAKCYEDRDVWTKEYGKAV